MPFGLKNAFSHFQKAMITIFTPILSNALVDIDDILLFSLHIQSHHQLLSQFSEILLQYDIMFSQKKMIIVIIEIDFLDMHISNGQYSLQPHIATKLQGFPNQLTSVKQIQ